jgi:putative sugar O-methyltransferase
MKKITGYIQYIIYLLGTKLFAILPKRHRRVYLLGCRMLEYMIGSTEAASKKSSVGFEGRWIDSVETRPDNEMDLVQSVVSAYHRAKETQPDVPGAYQPDGELWGNDTLRARLSPYYDALSRGDLGMIAGYLRNFFRNEGISGLWTGDDAFGNFCRSDKLKQSWRVNTMIEQYLAWREYLPLTPVKELDAPRIGNPWGYRFNGMLLYEPVFEYNFQANYFDQILHGLQRPVVLEIGGGFGGLAHHLLNCNPGIKYIGLDLPEHLLIQTYYLSSIFPDAKIFTYGKDSSPIDRNILEHYDIVLLPNFELPRIASGIIDLIVNVRSLSEMPYNTISEYYMQIDRIGRLFFFHENPFKGTIEAMNNRIPTSEFPGLKNFIQVTSSESRWPKYQRNSYLACQENLYIHRHSCMPPDRL